MESDNTGTLNRSVRRILLYGDVNLNIMDGSAVWLVSMAEAMARTHSQVDVLLKSTIADDRLVQPLLGLDNVRLLPPLANASAAEPINLTPRVASQRIAGLHTENRYDAVIVRGFRVSQFMASSKSLVGKLWLYVTDLPFPVSRLDAENRAALEKVCAAAFRLFAQTEDARSYLEGVVPIAAGKTLVLPPMIPDELFAAPLPQVADDSAPLRLVYSGKFAKDWKTLEMCGLPVALREQGVTASITMIGDKFQDDRADPTWPERMRAAIVDPECGWVGALPREQALELIASSDLGLGWRSQHLDSSLELSTKALEYSAAGVPPLINRTRYHEEIFGADYPYFVSDQLDSVVDCLRAHRRVPLSLREHVREIARPYSLAAASGRLEECFERAGLAATVATNAPLKVVVAGHDLKFAGELLEFLSQQSTVEMRIDHWTSLHTHDESKSVELLEWADVVLCEWAGPNAAWYSQRVKPGQRLIIRLHMFELNGPWLPSINIDRVDRVVCVSSVYEAITVERTGWPANKVSSVGNAIDFNDLHRPKTATAPFTLGLAGIVPFRKRPDRALDLLQTLRESDDRFTLRIRGRMPWEYSWEWQKGLQRNAYMEFFQEVARRRLEEHVVFEDFGPDMGGWLRRIGYVLSPSTAESFHLVVAEGMASGAVPVVWDRPGAGDIFGEEFIVRDTKEAVSRILCLTSDPVAHASTTRSAAAAVRRYDIPHVGASWLALLHEAAPHA